MSFSFSSPGSAYLPDSSDASFSSFSCPNLDDYYAPLYEDFKDEDLLWRAGFFENKSWKKDYFLEVLTTPFSHIQRALSVNPNLKNISVLVATGAFAPIHDGHVAMLEAAKKALEARGETVVQGYVHPDHDGYVLPKVKDKKYDAVHRLNEASERLSDSSWIEVDPWASRWAKAAVNFTTILDRTNAYLSQWLPDLNIKVYMVYGGDNAKFAGSFYKTGQAVCIQRGEADLKSLKDQAWFNGDNVLNVVEPVSHLSSTYIRSLGFPSRIDNDSGIYAVRDDWDESVAWMSLPLSKSSLLKEELLHLLSSEMPEKAEFKVLKYESPSREETFSQPPVISLDLYIKGDYPLGVSRLFYPSSAQHHSSHLVARPGDKLLAHQIEQIPAGTYDLLDDDIASGFTTGYISALLQPEREINAPHSLLSSTLPDENIYDIVDLRDFILGSEHGGLVLETHKGKLGRAPYLFPYVNLIARGRITPSAALPLSYSIWEWNKRLHGASNLWIQDLPKYSKDFWLDLGFDSSMSLTDLCAWHLDRLPKL